MALLGDEDCLRIPSDVLEKLNQIVLCCQQSASSSDRRAAEAYEHAIRQSKAQLDEMAQHCIEMEMQIISCKTQVPPVPDAPAAARPRHLPMAGGLRREAAILREHLRAATARNDELARQERSLNAQIEFLLGSADHDRQELLRIMAEHVAELSKYKNGPDERTAGRPEEKAPNGMKREVEGIKALIKENERLRSNEGEYQKGIFDRSAEINRLQKENNELKMRNGIMDQYKARYDELHDRLIMGVARMNDARKENQALKRVIKNKEELHRNCLLDLAVREELMGMMDETKEALQKIASRQASGLDKSMRQGEDIGKKLECLKELLGAGGLKSRSMDGTVANHIESLSDDAVFEEADDISKSNGMDSILDDETENANNSDATERQGYAEWKHHREQTLKSVKAIKWELEDLKSNIEHLRSISARAEALVHQGVGRARAEAGASHEAACTSLDYNDSASQLQISLVQKENDLLRLENNDLKHHLLEAELLGSGERIEDAPSMEYVRGLEEQLAFYKKDIQSIEEKFESYKQLYESFNIQQARDSIAELSDAVAKKDAYIEKQNLLLEKYRKLKEAFVSTKKNKI